MAGHKIRGTNVYSLLIIALFTLCSGFVLSSSAAGSSSHLNVFTPGNKLVYAWKSSVSINEIPEDTKNVGFDLKGSVSISVLWGVEQERILKIELNKVKLASQSEPLKSYQNHPFLLVLSNGRAEKVLFATKEESFLKNLKKGLAGLLQFQGQEHEDELETDTSGRCRVMYTYQPNLSKVKSECFYQDSDSSRHLDEILGINIISSRVTNYTTSESGRLIKSVHQFEKHTIHLQSKQELGAVVGAKQELIHDQTFSCDTISSSDVTDAISQIVSSDDLNLIEESLEIRTELLSEPKLKKYFSKEVASLRDQLNTDFLGSVTSAKAFLPLLEVARYSSSEDISKSLSSKKNKQILPQLYDALGYAQTENSHAAVMKHLHLDSEEHADLIERYLWALSFSIHPSLDILKDLLEKYRKYVEIPEKTKSTLILTIASMARNLRRDREQDPDIQKILNKVQETIINSFDYAKGSERYVLINALKNLQTPPSLTTLTSVLKNGTLKEEVLAWKAIKSFGKNFWTTNVLKQAQKTLFQLDRTHDTSSRTLAIDLLLGAGPSDSTLQELLYFVASNATYEVRQYAFQSIKMLSEKCKDFNQRVSDIIRNNKKLNNYSSLSPRGLSTALSRSIFSGNTVNGSLVSVQEIKSGIVKRGVVDVILDKGDISKELFTLGIFAGGLSSFVSSGEDEDIEDESATAGMELTVLGTQIRPFVFFEGQGELMGHVWSGTASDMTPAFQALILIQDHQESLRLGNGFIVDIDLKGSVSFDLSGKIEVSIWSRNAQSLIKKSVGYVSKGRVHIGIPFADAQLDFEGSIEPQLNLEIDADFSGDIKLCMRLSQPNSVYRQTVSKTETPQMKQHPKLRTSRKKEIPGFTYALNTKNSEMCSAIFS